MYLSFYLLMSQLTASLSIDQPLLKKQLLIISPTEYMNLED